MPLTLITGPANAAKAGAVLTAFRTALERSTTGRRPAPAPLLVVPTAADVEPYQRELAAAGAVFGGEVATFSRLLREIGTRAGVTGRPLGRVARERVVRAVVAEARPEVLARSAASPGFAGAVGRLFAELQRALVTPQRFTQALRVWGAAAGRTGYAEEVAGLYAAYRSRLEALGRVDSEGHGWAALDALRADPASWGARPVFLYGFDDLTEVQLDAVDGLVRAAGAEVTAALTYEPGRAAFASRARTVEQLRPLADRVEALPERSEHYAPQARAALHHLERSLFEADVTRVGPGGAVRLLEAGGERAEAELVGSQVLELLGEGVPAAEIAVLVRGRDERELLAQVLEGYGVPVALEGRRPLARTRLGAGLLAFAAAALDGGRAQDVLTWLRTPGRLPAPEDADGLEAAVRRGEVATAAEAEYLWAAPLASLEEARGAAAAEGVPAFLDVLEAELEAIWTAPYRRAAALLDADGREDARVVGEVRAACAELRGLAAADPALAGRPADALEALRGVEVRTAASPGVLVANPLGVRARRFRAVFVCGLQDGAWPRRPAPEPFLDDDDRRELAEATGLVLPRHEDALDDERYLFYAAVSRPQELLLLSWRSSDEDGEPQPASPFVDDVRELFTEELWEGRERRLLEVVWPPAKAPTPLELRRALAAAGAGPEPAPLAPPRSPAVLAELAARDREAARGLESFAACGVRWLVESLLRPERVEPDPEPMRRGSLAHAVLERTLRGLKERTGSARIVPATLAEAERELDAALAEVAAGPGIGAGARGRAVLRGLEVDLRRTLREEAEHGPGLEPEWLEWRFGGEGDEHGPLPLSGVAVTGRVDRVDVAAGDGEALVRDYKHRKVHPRARWAQDGHLQAALYALAVRELLGADVAGAVYQPVGGRELRPRGLVRRGGPAAAGDHVVNDVVDPEEFEAALAEARGRAEAAAAALHAGRVRPCPERCSPRGCLYPAICRAGEGAGPEGDDG